MLQNILLIFYLRQILSKLMVHIPYKLTMVQNRYCQNLSSHYQRIMVHIPYKLTMVQNRYCQNLSSHHQRITLLQNIKNNLSTLISNRFLTSQYLFILYNGQIYIGIKYYLRVPIQCVTSLNYFKFSTQSWMNFLNTLRIFSDGGRDHERFL